MGPTFGRPYGNAGFAKSEAEEAKNCLSPEEERIGASFFSRRRRFQAKSQDFHTALTFFATFLRQVEACRNPARSRGNKKSRAKSNALGFAHTKTNKLRYNHLTEIQLVAEH